MMKTPAPKCSWSGFQVPSKMKPSPEWFSAGAACQMSATTSDTATPTNTSAPPQRMPA